MRSKRNNMYYSLDDIASMTTSSSQADIVYKTIQSSCRAERRNNKKSKELKSSLIDIMTRSGGMI